jgi:hypothetical protein
MCVRIVLQVAILVLTIAGSGGFAAAGQRAVAHTNNPGGNGYYPDLWLAARPGYAYVFATCHMQHRYYGETIVLDGRRYSCP